MWLYVHACKAESDSWYTGNKNDNSCVHKTDNDGRGDARKQKMNRNPIDWKVKERY